MDTKANQIRAMWKKTKLVHPSYGEIAQKVGTNKGYVWKVVQAYLKKVKKGKN